MKKQLLLIILALLPMAASADESGTCGTDVTWTYEEETKSLIISGNGDIENYSKNWGADTPWNNYKNTIEKIIIADGVTSIGDYAFCYCSNVTSISLSESVIRIGNYAFFGCTGLTSATIPNSVTRIDDNAFGDCISLTSMTIGNNVTSIGNYAFSGCKELSSLILPNKLWTIGNYAFQNCTGLTSLTIPNSVTYVEHYAFSCCRSLKNVTIEDGEQMLTFKSTSPFLNCPLETLYIGRDIQYNSTSPFLEMNTISSVTIGDCVTSISNNIFLGCSGLSSIKVESGNNIFDSHDDCNAIIEKATNTLICGCKNTTIPNSVTSIGNFAFYECTGLTSVTIPEGVTSIGSGAFCSCSSLTSVSIPNSVTSIGSSAFQNCTGLTSVTIPNSVTNIGYSAFDNTFWYDNQSDGLVYAGNVLLKYKGVMPDETEIVIRDGIKSIASAAFKDCTGLTSVTIPNSVVSIESMAFYKCILTTYH